MKLKVHTRNARLIKHCVVSVPMEFYGYLQMQIVEAVALPVQFEVIKLE